jgi:oxygen-independent coproporphyrinogen III oxidase
VTVKLVTVINKGFFIQLNYNFYQEIMSTLLETVEFNADLLRKYNQPLPRYTSYPPATELRAEFPELDYREALAKLNEVIAASNQRRSPLSLYFHIPFCQSTCYFCGCNTIVSNNKNIAQPYLEYLTQEIKQTSALLDRTRQVVQLHWGGGTPNYLNLQQVELLWKTIERYFDLADDAELSIEINPRYVDKNYIFSLRETGFNRISFGIQDFNPEVQLAVNRVQPEEMLFHVMDWIKDAGFESVNVDLIYGLPHQALQTFEKTLEKTLKLDPDRIAVFNFAYVPWLKPAQKNIPEQALPSPQEKLEILKMTIEKLTQNQYLFIGMDHFAKSNDELAIAQQNGTLKRNFQGYTTQADTELFVFGMTSISMLHDMYAQNHRRLKDYYRAIESGKLPLEKGIWLNRDDTIRRDAIVELMCHFQLDKQVLAEKYYLDFDEYFALEKSELQALEADGLVRLFPDRIEVTPTGRLLIRYCIRL